MARVIILSFRDNATAEAFIEKTLDAKEGTEQAVVDAGLLVASGAKIEAMLARPTQPCRCRGKKHYVRTPRFGWMVHSGRDANGQPCNRPSPYLIRDFIGNMLGGANNILPEILKRRREAKPAESSSEEPARDIRSIEDPVERKRERLRRMQQDFGRYPLVEGVVTVRRESIGDLDSSAPVAGNEPDETKYTASRSGGDGHHMERRGDSVSCGCQGFGYRGHCWATDAWKKELAQRQTSELASELGTTIGEEGLGSDDPRKAVVDALRQQAPNS